MSTLESKLLKPTYINAAFRSPIGRFGGSLSHLSAAELASMTLKSSITKSNVQKVDFVFMGHARQAGAGPNPARQAALLAGLAETIPAYTLNQACASGLCAITTGVDKIQLGQATQVWAGGVESMSNTPYLLPKARWGQKLGHSIVLDGMYQDGFFCPMSKMVMGQTVEDFIVKDYKISRKAQDEFAAHSQFKAKQAQDKGSFDDEILEIKAIEKNPGLKTDEHARADSTVEKLSKLSPVFNQKGTITAGNSSGITDGASWLLLSCEKSKDSLVEIVDYTMTALDPKRMGMGPVISTQTLLKRNNLKITDLDTIELNEAFAAQALACQKELKFDDEILNPNGGAIALGHPIGATGARITTSLVHKIKGSQKGLGIATLCVSGGMGFSLLVKSI